MRLQPEHFLLFTERSQNEKKKKKEVDARFLRPLNADTFHLVCGLPQSGRVSDQDRKPADIE